MKTDGREEFQIYIMVFGYHIQERKALLEGRYEVGGFILERRGCQDLACEPSSLAFKEGTSSQ